MKPLAIAAVNLRRALRQPTTIVLYMVLPLILILILGAAFGGGSDPRAGVVAPETGPLAQRLQAALLASDGISFTTMDTEAALIEAVENGELDAGLVIPDRYDEQVAGEETVTLRYVARSDLTGQRVNAIIAAVVGQESTRYRSARFTAHERAVPFEVALDRVTAVEDQTPLLTLTARTLGSDPDSGSGGRFDASAYTQLLLFMFMLAMTGSAALLETKRLGLSRRMVSTPTSTWAIVTGEALGQWAITVAQGLLVMLVSALAFGVHWGNPAAAAILMIAFSLVATGAGMVLGVTAVSERTATPIAILLSLGLAALGGTMMPLEFFSPTMQTIAHCVTPHAWAVDGFATLISHNGDITDIKLQLAVLFSVAMALLGGAASLMRHAVNR